MKVINRLLPTLPTPVSDRRITSGMQVRFFYALGLIAVFGYFIYYFGQVLIFIDGTGIVTSDVNSISVPFIANVKTINIQPGMKIDKGEEIATIYSPEINNELSRLLTTIASLEQRQEELKTKISIANSTLNHAKLRTAAAKSAEKKILLSKTNSLNTAYKLEVLREASTAAQSESQLSNEKERATIEINTLELKLSSLEKQLFIARTEYNNGKIVSMKAGVVGARIAHPGETLLPGQNIADVYDDTQNYIRWMMPYAKWHHPKANDQVYVIFGNNYLKGYVWEVSPVTDLLDNKRTSVLREPEQGQVVKIKLKNDTDALPIGAQVEVRMMYFKTFDWLYSFVSTFLRSNLNYY
jgi:hypothetical protein